MGLILVVDDEKDACLLMQRVISRRGHSVHTVTEVDQAMNWLEGNRPDLVLLDLKLRSASGITVLEYIRQNQPDTKVMIVTGYPCVEAASRARRLGIADFLVKPIEIDELEQRINTLLAHNEPHG